MMNRTIVVLLISQSSFYSYLFLLISYLLLIKGLAWSKE